MRVNRRRESGEEMHGEREGSLTRITMSRGRVDAEHGVDLGENFVPFLCWIGLMCDGAAST